MIIYDKTNLDNLIIQRQASNALHMNMMDNDELKKVSAAYPVSFYTPNFFIRSGLFILTCITVSFSVGLISLMLSNLVDNWGYILVLGLISYAALEFVVKTNKHYRSGIDDALIWISAGFFLSAFLWPAFSHSTIDDTSYFLSVAGVVCLLGLYYTLRFSDALAAAVCFLAFLAFIAMEWNRIGAFGSATLPFLLIAVSFASWFFARMAGKSAKAIYYLSCLDVVQIISLLTLYLAGNYFVVQNLGNMLFDTNEDSPGSLPFAPFFWIWSVLLPFVYIGWGLKKKDVIMLRAGMLLIAAAVFTFKIYYHVAPIEVTLALGGAAFLAISYTIRRYLKTPKHGFTYEDLNENHMLDKINVESLLITETFSDGPAPAENRFGGGDFGGGGSSSGF